MSRNKGPTVPSEETQETKAPKKEKPNKGGNTPRDRASANQKQNTTKKISREEAKPAGTTVDDSKYSYYNSTLASFAGNLQL